MDDIDFAIKWTCIQAIQYLFFYDVKTLPSNILEPYIRDAFEKLDKETVKATGVADETIVTEPVRAVHNELYDHVEALLYATFDQSIRDTFEEVPVKSTGLANKLTASETAQAIRDRIFNDIEALLSASIEQCNGAAFERVVKVPIKSSVPEYESTVTKAVKAIRSKMPMIKPYHSLHPILWTRWALQSSGLPISSSFMLQLAKWRAMPKPWSVRLLQHWNEDTEKWRGKKKASNKIAKRPGYTLDDMISRKTFPYDEYAQTWKIKRMKYKADDKDKKISKPIEEICGKKHLGVLAQCIATEAKNGTQGLLSKRRKNGRYECTVTCIELIQYLLKHYPELEKWKAPSSQRCVSKFVNFKGSRPAGHRKL